MFGILGRLIFRWGAGTATTPAPAVSIHRVYRELAPGTPAVLHRPLLDTADSIDGLPDVDVPGKASGDIYRSAGQPVRSSLFRRKQVDSVGAMDSVTNSDTLKES